jgi:catechol-2,3-dioxygenase
MAFAATINYITVAVRDLDVSGPWYRKVLGGDPLLDGHAEAGCRHLVWMLDGGTVFGIRQDDRQALHEEFSEHRVGLDYVGFGCANRDELEVLANRLGELGIENSGVVDGPCGAGLDLRDPDGMALEFFAPPG